MNILIQISCVVGVIAIIIGGVYGFIRLMWGEFIKLDNTMEEIWYSFHQKENESTEEFLKRTLMDCVYRMMLKLANSKEEK